MSSKILCSSWIFKNPMHRPVLNFARNIQASSPVLCKQTESYSSKNAKTPENSTVDQADVDLHTGLIEEWWDPKGSMKALHSYNLLRVPFIRDGLCDYKEDERPLRPLLEMKILDVGCGGGVLSEPLAVLGAQVTGLDPSPELIKLAESHAQMNQEVWCNMPSYVCSTIEEHVESHKDYYDAVVASEVIEHVNNKPLFVKSCVQSLKKGGKIFFTTPNKTKLANLLVINVAENIIRMVPKGTHQIEKFTTPTELTFMLERNGCHVDLIQGMVYSILNNKWYWTRFQQLVFALRAVKVEDDPTVKKLINYSK